MKPLPLKTLTTRRVYEEKQHARHQLQGQNGAIDGAKPPSGDNTLDITHPWNQSLVTQVSWKQQTQ